MKDTHRRAGRLRCLVVWLAATLALGGLLLAVLPDVGAAWTALRGPAPAAQPFDRLLVWMSAFAAAVAAVWLWVLVTLVVLEALGAARRERVPGVPTVVRRVVLLACGVAVLGAGTPALAGAADADHGERSGPARIQGLPLPDRATGEATLAWLAETVVPHVGPVAAHRGGHVVVRPGDSLWTIAGADLPPGASDADVAAHWRRIYRLNRDVVGPDPDLIHPGQRLELPPT
jgi:nucleoid-associated protein YgaU